MGGSAGAGVGTVGAAAGVLGAASSSGLLDGMVGVGAGAGAGDAVSMLTAIMGDAASVGDWDATVGAAPLLVGEDGGDACLAMGDAITVGGWDAVVGDGCTDNSCCWVLSIAGDGVAAVLVVEGARDGVVAGDGEA